MLSFLRSLGAGSRCARTLAVLLALFLVVGGCGGGGSTGSTQQQFFLQVLGPAGGTASAGPVTVIFPPGALPQDTRVDVLPELTPLPIQPPVADPCIYAYAGPIHCCGPLSLQLAVPATLRVTYDEALIPPGLTELDLVLLVSDPLTNNTVMVPKIGPSVTQFTVSNFFEDTNYNPLGHVAIGVRTCPAGRLLVQNNVVPALQGPGGGAPRGFGFTELYLVDPLGGQAPALVSTNDQNFDDFLASPSGDRVLLRMSDPISESSLLATVPLPAGGVPVTVFSDDPGMQTFLQGYDPHYGWLKGAAGDEVFAMLFQSTLQAQGSQVPTDTYGLWRRDGAAALPPILMRSRDSAVYYPDDLRQSATGAQLMLRWGTNFFSSGLTTGAFIDGAVDVLTSPAAGVLSEGLIPPNGFGGPSPRFMTQVNDLYVIQGGSVVERYQSDGTFDSTLFDPGFESGEILVDFALAPDDETFAMVFDVPFFGKGAVQQGPGTSSTILAMGTLTDGVLATFDFFSQQFVEELVWHPQQTGVFLDLSGWNVGFYRLEESKGTFVNEIILPTSSMTKLDVNRVDGRIVLINDQVLDVVAPPSAGPNGLTQLTGLYVSPADASDFQPVELPGLFDVTQARWVESWRNQAGMGSARVR